MFTKLLKIREKTLPCPTCGELSTNQLKAGTVRVMDHLDNGLMARAVERLADIEEINEKDAEIDNTRFKERMGISDDEGDDQS